MATLLAGCGASASHGPNERELALERTQFVRVSAGLQAAEEGVRREVSASRVAWPRIANGLPRVVPESLRAALARASAAAGALPQPSFLHNPTQLTGPSAGIAGLYESYDRLAERGWRLTSAALGAIAAGTPEVAGFERHNSSLYIDAIYDGHFNLSLVGKSLLSGYQKLGGAGAFGSALPSGKLAALASAYSIPAVRLAPHPAGAANEG